MYSLKDYTYSLPPELIAQEATHPHHDARLMIIDRESGALEDESTFWHLEKYIPSDRVLFFNNSRVLPARIRLEDQPILKADETRGVISHGEILFLAKRSETTFEALIRPGKKFDIGTKICFSDEVYLMVKEKTEEGRILEAYGSPIEEIMRKYGELPLPPYIDYTKEKETDYQTVFAEKDGSVAAPTASLHFTRELLEKIPNEKFYVTLHVGLGTFQSIDTDDIRDYHIHRELIEAPRSLWRDIMKLKTAGKKILAVGTTACRTLESLPHLWKALPSDIVNAETQIVRDFWDELTVNIAGDVVTNVKLSGETVLFETEIYIYPGIPFRIVDDLITNFHLSESSLLVLVSAFLRGGKIGRIYQRAIEGKYRFYSFGDGMYIKS